MIVYRLPKKKYARDVSGLGAMLAGGRWNEKGVALLYTSESRALCALEVAVHVPLSVIPTDYVMVTLEIPDTSFSDIDAVPKDWKRFPYDKKTQAIGEGFVADGELALRVPSAIVQGDYNILINPNHRDSSKIKILKIEPFAFDARLFRKA